MLKVGFDATPAVRQKAGIGRYARELLRALLSNCEDLEFRVVYASRGPDGFIDEACSRCRVYPIPLTDRVTNFIWKRLRLPIPIELRCGRIDVFHCPDFSLPPSMAKSIVTIHDLAFEVLPQLTVPSLAAYLHHVVPHSIGAATAVIVPSVDTKKAVTDRFGTAPEKIHVIHEGASSDFQTSADESDAAIRTSRKLDNPYLLTVSTLEPRKNIERLLRAFSLIADGIKDVDLLVVGRPGWMYEGIFEAHANLSMRERVRILTDVDDWELPALYRQALLTVYPSTYEGFGLPVLEALACGSPLAVSGNSSLPEVAGECALYFDPWDVEDIATTVMRLVHQDALRQRLEEIAPARAAQFTWERAATQTADLYRRVANA